MKNKALKSTALTAALAAALALTGAHAQTSGTGNITIAFGAAPVSAIAVTAGDISFGTFALGTTAGNIVGACSSTTAGSLNAMSTTFSAAAVATETTAGTCGAVTTAVSGSITDYTVSVANFNLTSTNNADITVTPQIYSGGSAVSGAQTGNGSYFVGGSLAIAANQGPGTYSGTYTFTATVN